MYIEALTKMRGPPWAIRFEPGSGTQKKEYTPCYTDKDGYRYTDIGIGVRAVLVGVRILRMCSQSMNDTVFMGWAVCGPVSVLSILFRQRDT